MSETIYDVVVLGSGPGGGVVARQCADAGLGVAVVECDGWGGVCPLRGCEPKKTLADTAHAVTRVKGMAGKGVVGDIHIDWPALMRFKRSLIDPIPEKVLKSFESRGIDSFAGQARLAGEGKVMVDGHGIVEGRTIVIATGARPRPLDVPGHDLLMTSREFLDMDVIPQSIIFVGGGFISFEFASIAHAAGTKATILHRSERVLKGFDPVLSRTLVEGMQGDGIEIFINHPVLGVEATDFGVAVTTRDEEGEERIFKAEKAVLGGGRIPNVDNLGLDEAGVEYSPRGITVDECMQSVSNPKVYAVGDCAEHGLPLTPTAVLQADVAAQNIIHDGAVRSDLRGSASVVFTAPALAAVGLQEEQAREQGIDFEIHEGDARWPEHERVGVSYAGYRILEEKGTGRILGAHYLGQHAEEVINVFGLAIRHGLTREALLGHPWSYPSFGYALRYML